MSGLAIYQSLFALPRSLLLMMGPTENDQIRTMMKARNLSTLSSVERHNMIYFYVLF